MLELTIALRYLFSHKAHNAVNVISLISVGGVAVASMAIVIVLSVFNGFTQLTEQQISLLEPEMRVMPVRGKVLADADSLAAALNARYPGIKAVATLREQAFAIMGDAQCPITVLGVPDDWFAHNTAGKAIIDGVADIHAGDVGTAVLSVGTAVALDAQVADDRWLRIYVPKRQGRVSTASPMTAFRSDSLVVSGMIQTTQSSHAGDLVIAPLSVVRNILDYDTQGTSVELWGTDAGIDHADLTSALPPEAKVVTRREHNSSTFAMISVEKWITFAMLAFILVIASFNIISTLCLLVLEKRDNVAIMRSMGATPAEVTNVFVIEGWLISLSGGVVGIVLGVVLTLAQQLGGFVKLGGDHTQMVTDIYPVQLQPLDLLAVLGLVAATGLLTSVITAIFARRHAGR